MAMTPMMMHDYRNNIGVSVRENSYDAMTLMMMQDYRDKFGERNDLGNPNDDKDNKTKDYGEYKRKTIIMAMKL